MKKITFRNLQLDERETVKDVMNAVMANSPAKPIEINEMRRRASLSRFGWLRAARSQRPPPQPLPPQPVVAVAW